MDKQETIRTRIWREVPEPDNPFAAAACYCHGYDVFGDLLGKATWIEYLYLLFKGERPTQDQARLLQDLAIALANPGPRDHSVHAAMCGGVGGSHSAASLMAALAVGAGQLGGAREVALAMEIWKKCGTDFQQWKVWLSKPAPEGNVNVWPPMEHPPGFDPHGLSCATPIRQLLQHLAKLSCAPTLIWLNQKRSHLELISNCPLALTGVAAATFHDLDFSAEQGEMLFLLLRLPGAAAHSLEQQELGYRYFPFFRNSIHLENDPGPFQQSNHDPLPT